MRLRWATHSGAPSALAGLDVSMPGNDGFFTPAHLHAIPQAGKEAQMAARVLEGMLAAGARPTLTPAPLPALPRPTQSARRATPLLARQTPH